MNWKQLWEKVWTPKNRAKAIDAGIKAAEKMKAKELSKEDYKAGLADPVTLAVVAIVCGLLGGVFGHGVKTRSITTDIHIVQSSNVVVTVSGQKLEVSGSGGVSIPMSGGGK